MEYILRNVFIVTTWLKLGQAGWMYGDRVRDSTKDYRGTFMYKQRLCYQDTTHCIDKQNGCCLSSYDPDGDYCSDGTELVWEVLDCNDGSGTFTYQEDAGSYFCCEPIEGKVVGEGCAPPFFDLGMHPFEYLWAGCEYPNTLRWLYGDAGQCVVRHDYKHNQRMSGKYECVRTTSTSTTTRNSKKDFLGNLMYEGRQCYQNPTYSVDPKNDCCIGSYDHTNGNGNYCLGNTEIVFQGADCFDGDNLFTYMKDGGSYFCCEPIEGQYKHHKPSCRDNGNDCCARPAFTPHGAFVWGGMIEYTHAHCAYGHTIKWLYDKGEHCWSLPRLLLPRLLQPRLLPRLLRPRLIRPRLLRPRLLRPSAPTTKAPTTTTSKAPTTTTTASNEPLFRNKVYGWMSCENVKDSNRSTKECGVPYNFSKEANEHHFVKTCDSDDDFASVVATCKEACIDYNEDPEGALCEFYSVVKSESGCRCTLKNSYSLGRAAMVHKDTEWQAFQTLWYCDATKFVDPRYMLETSEDTYQPRCVYTLDGYSPESGGTWALNASNWSIVDECVKYGTNREGIQKYCPNVKDY